MQKFSFSLESVLKLREQQEQDAKLSLAEREGELSLSKNSLEEIKKGLNEFQAEEKESRKGNQSADALRQSVSWRHKFKVDISQKLSEIEQINRDIVFARNRLIEATKTKKGLEVLKEKKHAAWQKEYNRKEQLFLDELAQNSFIRKMGSNSFEEE
jgi:flagellar FliJ protein